MALITTEARAELIALYTAMFRAAPGATNLSAMVAAYETGSTTLQIANSLAASANFQATYPTLQTAGEFAAALIATMLPSTTPAAAVTWATGWITGQLTAGKSRAQIITEAVVAIRATTNTNYTDAQTQLTNKVDVATYYSVTKLQSSTSLQALQDVIDGVTAVAATVTTAKTDVDDVAANASGQTYTLTTGVDTVAGTIGNDVINSTDTTATGLDTISGNAGKDTLNYNDVTGGKDPAGLSLTGVETVIVRSSGAATVTSTASWTGVETLKVTQGTSASVVASGATALDVSGITGAVKATAGTGSLTAAATQAANAVDLEGGSTVTATLTGVTTGTVKVGQVTLPTGAVSLTSTGAASVAATDATLGAILIDGGSTVTVTQTATSSGAAAAADATGATVTQSSVGVDGGATTTAVTVTQSAPVAETLAVTAVAGSFETNVITFVALAKGGDTAIGGLKFTASKDLTAAQVAAAYANLAAGTTQGSAPAANGIYNGTLVAAFASGAAADTVVTFTSTTKDNVTDLDPTTGTTDMATVKTDGVKAVTGVTGILGVAGGAVTVKDSGGKSITTANLTGFANSTVDSSGLSTLTLASSFADVAVTNTAVTTLALNVNGVGKATDKSTVTTPTYTTINLAASGAASVVDLVGTATTTLAISGDKAVTLTGATLAVLATVTVTGAGGATFDIDEADTITSFNASGASGAVTGFVDPTKATYTGGSGVDTVTLTAAAPTKAISMGAGNDVLNLAAGTTASTSALEGGDGTGDTLQMDAADAVTASAAETFEAKFGGFERLGLNKVAADGTVNLANMDDISYVVVGVVDAGKTQTFTKMASGGTLERTGAVGDAAASVVVTLTDATGSADTLNLVTTVAADTAIGKVSAAGVETVNVTTSGAKAVTLTIVDAALTTMTVTGNSNLTLTLDAGVVALTSLNAAAMTGKLTAGTNGTVAQTILGGTGADTLTANGTSDVLNGGAGADTLIVGAAGNLTSMTGGSGADIFNVALPTTNVNSYATITDLAAGDKILFSATSTSFAAAQITQGDTAVFQDFANFAINNTDTGAVSWFQFAGNTYVIENVSNGTSFVNGTDTIVKISGLMSLTTASFSSSAWTLLIV